MEKHKSSNVTTRTRKSAADRKTEIVRTAIRLAAETGPDRLTTQQLAEEIGISQPAIFRHFPTKGDIWLAVGQQITTALDVSAEGALEPGQSPGDRICQLVARHLSSIQKNPAIPAILFSRELHAENDQLRQRFADLMANRQAVFASLIAQGIAGGEFRNSVDANDAAGLILALVQGLAMRWSLHNRSFDLVSEGAQLLKLQIDGFRVI